MRCLTEIEQHPEKSIPWEDAKKGSGCDSAISFDLLLVIESVPLFGYSLGMSNPYIESQTHMSKTRRPPDVSNAESSTPSVEAGSLPPVPSSTYETGYRHDAVPAWLAPILQGITIVILVGFAFWFGALSKTVEHTAKTVDELRVSHERMGNRLTAIETQVESMDKRLTGIETKVESMDNRLTVVETKLNSMDKKLDRVTRP